MNYALWSIRYAYLFGSYQNSKRYIDIVILILQMSKLWVSVVGQSKFVQQITGAGLKIEGLSA